MLQYSDTFPRKGSRVTYINTGETITDTLHKDTGEARVKIETSKSPAGVRCVAYMEHAFKRNGYTMVSTMIYGNGYGHLLGVLPCKRVTEQALDKRHAEALASFTPAQVVELVKARLAKVEG